MTNDMRTAFAFLTILPMGYRENHQPGRSFSYFPLVGLVIGLILCAIGWIMPGHVSPVINGFCILLVWVVLTGGLHLDGFADSCDALLATTDAARRLEIMKDPRVGSWAVVGLVLLLLGKWAALEHVAPILLILPPVLGRWGMVLAAYSFSYARTSGTGAYFRNGLGREQMIGASLLTLVIVGICVGLTKPVYGLLLAVPMATVFVLGRWAAKRLSGGLTGDVYGALCEVIELLILLSIQFAP
jgi:adenosylcobinamide-GDP ribazoletransferase